MTKLQFTEEERADPSMQKVIHKAEKAGRKADNAQKKLPKKPVLRHTDDPAGGKKSVKLQLEERKKPPSKLNHAVRQAPAAMVLSGVHREIRQNEDDNVGVESAHKSEEVAESSIKLAQDSIRSQKLKPYRNAAKAEKELDRANVNALVQRQSRDNPQLSSNPISRWQQKQNIKKQYAAAKRNGENARETAAETKRVAQAAAEKAKQAAKFVWAHKKGFAIAGGIVMILAMLLSMFSSCSVLVDGVGSMLAGATYPSADEDMLAAEAAYSAMEAELQNQLDHYAEDHPEYDQVVINADPIGHDPYVLISLISAYHGGPWTMDEVQDTIQMLFEKQYELTTSTEIEEQTRVEMVPDADGILHPVEVPYDHKTVTVKLTNNDLSHLPLYVLNEAQAELYAHYMATLGNRPDLFPHTDYPTASEPGSYEDYEIPPEALEDEVFAAMIAEAEKYLGFPYVWGGSKPETSFDCSGFVSWVVNHSGWSIGRRSAQGLLDVCTRVSPANARPGDLIFFERTYDTHGASHVGIYVGNNKMIHCGSPISYASTNTPYWQDHFLAYGRLP